MTSFSLRGQFDLFNCFSSAIQNDEIRKTRGMTSLAKAHYLS